MTKINEVITPYQIVNEVLSEIADIYDIIVIARTSDGSVRTAFSTGARAEHFEMLGVARNEINGVNNE